MNTKSFIQIILKKDFYRVKKNIYITLKIYISKNRIHKNRINYIF